jgi:2-haloacid dehalogenase
MQRSVILFDAYGTLIDLDGIHAKCVKKILELEKAGTDPDEFHRFWDERERANAEAAAAATFKGFHNTQSLNDKSLRETFEHFGIEGDYESGVELWIEMTRRSGLFPDVRGAIDELRGEFAMGMVSNSDNYPLLLLLKREGVDFEVIVTSETARCYKPNPRIFRFALKAMGRKAEESAYVGDTPWTDFPGARELGIMPIWINRKGRKLMPDEPAPDHEIGTLASLKNVLLGKKGGSKPKRGRR